MTDDQNNGETTVNDHSYTFDILRQVGMFSMLLSTELECAVYKNVRSQICCSKWGGTHGTYTINAEFFWKKLSE